MAETPEAQIRTALASRIVHYGLDDLSRLGDEFRNWSLFEPPGSRLPVDEEPETLPIEADDPDLRQALESLGVRLVSPRASWGRPDDSSSA